MLLEGAGAKISVDAVDRCLRSHPQGRAPGPAGGALDHQRDRIWAGLPRCRGRGAGRVRRSSAGSLSTWTARGSPTPLASTGESLADLTWRAGVDALSFGFVKNGGLNAEALILFRTELADEIAVRRKRAGHLLSKGRFLAAQILAMLEDDLWLDNARAANAAAQTLAKAAPRAAGLSGRSQRDVPPGHRRRGGTASRQGLRFLRLGAGRNPAGHQLGSQGEARSPRRSDRGAVSSA